MRWRRRYDCKDCKDSGMLPGSVHRNLVVMPRPCHCERGQERARAEERAVKRMSIGGLPPVEGRDAAA